MDPADRPVSRPRWWHLALALAAVLAASGLAYKLVEATGALQGLADDLHASGRLEEWAMAVTVLAAGVTIVAAAAARRLAQGEAATRRQSAVLDVTLASVPEALLVSDGRRYKANAAAVRLFGLPSDAGDTPQLLAAVQHLDLRDQATGRRVPLEAGVLSAALEGRSTAIDQTLKTREGDRVIHMMGVPIHFPGGTTGGLVLASDVTQRLQTQAALLSATERLQQQEAERVRLVRALAHDLGNAILPAALQLRILGKSEGNARSVEILDRSIAQMQRLVNDLSDMARLGSGGMEIHPQRLDLAAAVRDAVEAMQPMARDKGLTLSVEPPLEAQVRADPDRLAQVLMNLLRNAVKFTAAGTVRVRVEASGAMARVLVQDSGPGLTRDQVGRLFKPFSQVHDPGATKERGSGLGLYICKGIIEKHGGELRVDSPGPGHGSTFWFTLPIEPSTRT